MFSMLFHHRMMPHVMVLLATFSFISAALFAAPEIDDNLRFQELLARFETRRANRNAEAAKHGVILPSQKSAAIAADEIAPPNSVSLDMPDDPLLKHLIPMTEAETAFSSESATEIPIPAPSPEPAPSDSAAAHPTDNLELELSMATPREDATPGFPSTHVSEEIVVKPQAPQTCSEPPVFHSHEPTSDRSAPSPAFSSLNPVSTAAETPMMDSSKQSFIKVLAKLESRREKRNAEAAKLNIQLPSAGGSFPTVSPALERLNTTLRHIIHHQVPTSHVG